MSEVAYCYHCDSTCDCDVERGCGMTIWRCQKCGGIVDEDYDDLSDD